MFYACADVRTRATYSTKTLLQTFHASQTSRLYPPQNRLTDAGAIALAAALPKSHTLQHLTLSFNFIAEEGGRALLSAAKGEEGMRCPRLLKIQTEGNLFDEE